MKENVHGRGIVLLAAGDILALALVTIFGFATHGELGSSGARILTTFVPLVVGWFAVAPLMGAYRLEFLAYPAQLWRPFWAMVVGAPLAAWLRGAWLDAAILPIFVVVLGGIAALSILCWRVIYYILAYRGRSA